jgi:hypothetical protein
MIGEQHMDDLLNWLQQIYKSDFCNDSWEHEHGITIDTFDPGWNFQFDLRDTDLEDAVLEKILVKENEQNWYQCWTKDGIFHGWGGPTNLTNILKVFRDWYEKTTKILDENQGH